MAGQSALDGEIEALAAAGERGLVTIVMATHSGMTAEAFAKTIRNWTATARHPRFKRFCRFRHHDFSSRNL